MTIYGSKALRLSVYKVCKARHLEHQAQYDQYCADMAKEGYAPQYCIHGTNQWTDYDNICGGCESDYTLNDYIKRNFSWFWSELLSRFGSNKPRCNGCT